MDEYDLARLTDFDFEKLCKDILEARLGTALEIFPAGPDGGVDLRSVDVEDGTLTVIQCKHWIKSSRAALIRHMETKELSKGSPVKSDAIHPGNDRGTHRRR